MDIPTPQWAQIESWANPPYAMFVERSPDSAIRGRVKIAQERWTLDLPPDTTIGSAIEGVNFFVELHRQGAPLPPNARRTE